MMMTGQEIHNTPVKLFLSSKVEMSQVISDARYNMRDIGRGFYTIAAPLVM